MRRLAQFVRLRASRVCVCLASVSHLRLHLSRVRLASACICLASVCVCSRQGFRMRASASVSRLASVVLSRVCLASACVCLASVSRLRASVSRLSRVCLRRSSCLACVCLLVNACGNWLILCRSSFKEFKRFLLSSYYLIMSQCQSIHPIT